MKYFLPLFFLSFFFFAACKENNTTSNTAANGTAIDTLKERSKVLASATDWAGVQEKYRELFAKIKNDPNDNKSKLLLAQLYMQEARITGEHPYYYPATLRILDNVLAKDSTDFEALAFKSSVLLSLHHFSEALATGTKARAINASNGFIHGVLVDANVELGNYEEAVKMSDIMQTLRPGLEAYARASYLREIYGDNKGAIEAMKTALQSGVQGSEEMSWAGNTLCHLLENTGDLVHAEELTNIILQLRPSYAFAIDAQGRILMAQGKYDAAIAKFDTASKAMPEFSFYENMADAYAAKGDNAKAKSMYQELIPMLQEDAESGHYMDLELAELYIKLGDLEKAAKYAKIEYDRRPKNIDTNKSLAWVKYQQKNYAEAKQYIDVATRMGTQNAELLYRAGMIYTAAGDSKKGNELLAKAKKINPYFKA